jgi:prepilin-type N-terminal cleavage/methylation domain-containing protein
MKLPVKCNKGFTIIELLMVVALVVVLSSISMPMYGQFQSETQVKEVSVDIVQALRLAREKSMAAINGDSYGVYIKTGTSPNLILYKGPYYEARDENFDQPIPVNRNIIFATESLQDVRFDPGTGETPTPGKIIISNSRTSKSININRFGIVMEE